MLIIQTIMKLFFKRFLIITVFTTLRVPEPVFQNCLLQRAVFQCRTLVNILSYRGDTSFRGILFEVGSNTYARTVYENISSKK